MFLIVGLGNPGVKYKNTRHNIGFDILEIFGRKNGFPVFKLQKKTGSLISESVFGGKKTILALPQTFMNLSGKAVKIIAKNLDLKSGDLVVVHDDADLPLGKIKISQNRSSAGHKGVESLIKEVGSKNFVRIRVGIGSDENRTDEERKKKERMEDFVLGKFTPAEKSAAQKAAALAVSALQSLLENGLEKTMNEFNKSSD